MNFFYELQILEDYKVLPWVHSIRLPLFWESDTYLEYRLCSQLLQNNSEGSSSAKVEYLCHSVPHTHTHTHTQVLPEELQTAMGTVFGMHQFRKFLFDTPGEAASLFWLDVERLRNTGEDWVKTRLLSRIQYSYITDGAPFQLLPEVRDILLQSTYGGQLFLRESILYKAQAVVLENLRSYWCMRYAIHWKEFQEQLRSTTVSQVFRDEETASGGTERPPIPNIIVNEGNSRNDSTPEKAAHIRIGSAVSFPGEALRARADTAMVDSKLLEDSESCKDSIQTLLSRSTEKLMPHSEDKPVKHTSNPPEAKDLNMLPFMFAALRSDFVARNPFMKFLKSSHSKSNALNCLLFWQSVENILTQDEMNRWYAANKQREGPCPYLTNFELCPIARNLDELTRVFIKDKAKHRIYFPVGVKLELSAHLKRGLGQNMLISAQGYTAQMLIHPWKEFLRYDHNCFLKGCVS